MAESKEKAAKVEKRFDKCQTLAYDDVVAYAMKDGRIESIMDPDLRLISADALDSAYEEIADDLNFMLNV